MTNKRPSQYDLVTAARAVYQNKDGAEEKLKEAIEGYFAPYPDPVCNWCGMTWEEQEDNYGYGLLDMTVEVSDGEEGHAIARTYACAEHADEKTKALRALGFVSHRHGGINFLEPEDCVGTKSYGACPTPQEEIDPKDEGLLQTPVTLNADK